MKIFISADIEGVAGVVHLEQGQPGNPEYQRARQLMIGEVNAAIAGAYDGGATEILVNDSHGRMRNLVIEELDSRARLISGRPKPLLMMEGVIGAEGAILLGYHACAGAVRGVLAHTYNSFAFARTTINGKAIGEAGLNGAVAGENHVPVLMASGDDVLEAEFADYFPGAPFAKVKRAISVNCADNLSPQAAQAIIRTTARSAVQDARSRKPSTIGATLQCEARMNSLAMADLVMALPELERLDGHTLGFPAATAEEAMRRFVVLGTMVQSLR
jgi:D-amino peptidase